MAYVTTSLGEGQSIFKPPLFSWKDYSYWKNRIKYFIQSHDYEVWRVVMNGPFILIKMEYNASIPKEENEWNEVDIRKI